MTMTDNPVALVVGATGLSGGHLAERLKNEGWTVVTLSRGAFDAPWSDRHIAADLEDADASRAALADAGDVSHVFYCTWSRQDTEDANVRVNGAMIRNLFAGLEQAPLRHAGLVTGLKHYLGPFEDYATSAPQTPFLESQPRLPGPNFYYEQEDVLFEAAARRGLTWSVHRPHTMIGYALGNAMNMGVTLAVYATICRHTGKPFLYPGSQAQYHGLTDITDARILADQILWAATADGAQDRAYNIVNGDIFRWSWMWGEIAGYFGLDSAGCPPTPQPLEDQMADASAVWSDLVAANGLKDLPVERLASWWHTDADLGREIECVTDMAESRLRGFDGYRSSRQSFFDVFDRLIAENIIPDPKRKEN